ncbi:Ribosomal large subunit pseudouridine synthase D [Durusdinium trenchii]|uniref:Ribosomal large subunit pseudouridine synthase D n=1 Tax=Durusdinium trenchii TaxID=1381693 RepID=A0ABP0Q0J2_9DINO
MSRTFSEIGLRGSKGGSVPVAWLTIACEKELLRHIRYFPQYEQDMSQTSPHLAYLFEGMLPGTVTSQTPKALRKTRMACRLIALMAEAPGTFQLNSQPNTETAKDFLCDLITLKQSGMPKACNNPLDTLSSLTMRPNAIGEGRRAWRRALPSEMPRNASELTSKICRLPQADVWVLLLRCQGTRSKEAQLMVLEFQAAATGLGVCASSLHEVAVGMFALEVSGQAEAKFLQLARHLTSVRRPPIRLYRPEAFPTAEALAQYVPEILTQMKAESWWLEVELRETPTNHASLPLKHCPGAVLALKVTAHVANVASHTVEKLQECEERGENHLHLVALEANGGALLLGQEVPVELNQDELQLRPCGLPLAWHQSWQSRPFHFSAGLDSWVANAVVSLAAMESQQCSGFVPINFLDPCCGSGTLAAVAAASGAFTRVLARDVDAKFVERAKENFASADAQSRCRLIDINVHDGSTSFGEIQADVIVVNPPWGWRIGSSIASEKIILNLCHEFPNAVVAVICPEIPLSELVDAHFEIRWSCPLGQSAVWILVPTRPS